MPKISSACGTSTRSTFPVASVHASVPCRLPIPSLVMNWLPKTMSRPPGSVATPSSSVHGVVKTCVPAHACGVAAGGGGGGAGVLSGGAAGVDCGAAGVDCGVSVEGGVAPADAEGAAGGVVVTWDEVAAVPPPLSLAPPHPSRIAPEITAARTRMCASPNSPAIQGACQWSPTAATSRSACNAARGEQRASPIGSGTLPRNERRFHGCERASAGCLPTGRAEARRAPGQRQTGRLRVSAIHRARRTVVRCRRALLAPQSTLAGDPRHGALQSRHDLRGGGPLDLAGHEACRGSDRLRCCPALAAPCCTRDGRGRRCDLERTRRIRLFGGHK